MENETMTIRSSVLPALMRKILWKGTLLGGSGVVILLLGGIFIPLKEMKVWGPFLFLFSLSLITWGLLPYRRLKRLEEKPSTLILEGEEWLHYSVRGKPLFSIPIASIDHIIFIDKPSTYGIGVILKDHLPKKLVVQDTSFDPMQFPPRSLEWHPCDLFFQYFSQRSFNALHDRLVE